VTRVVLFMGRRGVLSLRSLRTTRVRLRGRRQVPVLVPHGFRALCSGVTRFVLPSIIRASRTYGRDTCYATGASIRACVASSESRFRGGKGSHRPFGDREVAARGLMSADNPGIMELSSMALSRGEDFHPMIMKRRTRGRGANESLEPRASAAKFLIAPSDRRDSFNRADLRRVFQPRASLVRRINSRRREPVLFRDAVRAEISGDPRARVRARARAGISRGTIRPDRLIQSRLSPGASTLRHPQQSSLYPSASLSLMLALLFRTAFRETTGTGWNERAEGEGEGGGGKTGETDGKKGTRATTLSIAISISLKNGDGETGTENGSWKRRRDSGRETGWREGGRGNRGRGRGGSVRNE